MTLLLFLKLRWIDIIAISETTLDHSVTNDDISIDGFSKEIYRSDHPRNTKIGGVCLYFREGLPIKRRTDLELLPEMILSEITLARKKIFFGTLYCTPSQNGQQFETFNDRLQEAFDKMKAENPHCIILTGDLTAGQIYGGLETLSNLRALLWKNL